MLRLRLLTFLLLCAWGPALLASTLDPSHPLWLRSDLDHEGFRAFARVLAENPPRSLRAPLFRAGKGLDAYGVRLLVIPVYYEGDSPPAEPARDTLRQQFFGGGAGSVRSYWQLVSGGRFQLEGEVLPWQQLPEKLSRYRNVLDGNLVGNGLAGPRELVRDVLREVSADWDLHRYDDDGADGIAGSGDDDGFIDLLVVLHPDAGFEVDPSASGPAMLAHSSFLSVADPELAQGGVQGGSYALASAQGPLGVWVHEFGHLLGLDDLYDLRVVGTLADEPHRGGLGLWSLMAHGTWGDGGARPSGLDAYSRRRLGWDEAEVWGQRRQGEIETAGLGSNRSVALLPFGDWEREYFLLERRERNVGGIVDGALPASGVLLYQVDAARSLLDDHDLPRVTLVQADGRDDLGELVNDGDAGDVFEGDVLLDGNSSPPLRSVRPDPARTSPKLAIGASAAGIQSLDYWPSAQAQLQLQSADFEDTPQRRAHLLPGESAPWRIEFGSVGPDPSTAFLDSLEVDPRLELLGSLPVELVQSGGRWILASSISLRDRSSGTQVDAPLIRWLLTVDGQARELEFGVAVGFFEGISGDDFYRWQPRVLGALGDTTRFELLGIEDLPGNASSGWQLSTDGASGYANRVESSLTSPWFAVPAAGELRLWSDALTESAGPGECYDGGVLEIQEADRPWRTLEVLGWGRSFVRAMSSAPTGDAFGFGGDDPGWRAYSAPLERSQRPVRARLRFGSNALWHDGHWAVAALGTRPEPFHATLAATRDAQGQWVATIEARGEAAGLANHEFRLYARRPADEDWLDLEAAQRVTGSSAPLRIVFEPPIGMGVVQLGLFVRSLALPDEPEMLLAIAGLRSASIAEDALVLLRNPARGRASFEVDSSGRPRRLAIFDLRGRLVRVLAIPPGVKRVHWDGRDDEGTTVASGRYFVVMDEATTRAAAITWIK